MKTKLFVLLLSSFFFGANLHADVIPENHHTVTNCTKITNINSFTDITFVGFINAWGDADQSYQIENNSCLTQGYHMYTLNIYAIKNSQIGERNIEEIDFSIEPNAFKTEYSWNVSNTTIHDSIPLTAINSYYRIMGFTEMYMVVHKWKEVREYEGLDDSVFTFEYEGDTTILSKSLILGTPNNEIDLFKVYPIPATDEINLSFEKLDNETVIATIYSCNGQLINNFNITENNYCIKLNNQTKGVYFMQVKFGDIFETRKIIIK